MSKEIYNYVRRERELKRSLSFGAWLRHIKDSHIELLRLLDGVSYESPPVRVEVITGDHAGATCSVYEVSGGLRKVIVDVSRKPFAVRGFVAADEPTEITQVNGKLIGTYDAAGRASAAGTCADATLML